LMMGLFYLVTLYASVRAHTSTHSTRWLVTAVLSSALGMACKQSMVTVPVAVVLVDRVFFFGSFADAFRSRWRFYLALAASSLVLVITTLASPTVRSMGFGAGVRPWRYLLNQSVMIMRYLALTIWPRALVVDYGYPRALVFGDVAVQMLFIASLAGLTVAAFRWRPKIALLGALFFITLSPSSSLVPIATEVGAERRMYLPIAALVVLAVSLVGWLLDRIRESGRVRATRAAALACAALWAVAAVAFAGRTILRNQEYASALTLARTVLDRWPSGHAYHVLGVELMKAGNRQDATVALREAIREDSRAHYTLGVVLLDDGQPREAREQLEEFLRLEPLLEQAVDARALIARSLFVEGRLDAAAEQFGLALAMRPAYSEAHFGLAETRFAQHQYADAIPEYRAYLRQQPTNDSAWINLGLALRRTGQSDGAILALRRAAELNPQSSLPYRNLASLLLEKGDLEGAAGQARQAVALRPEDPLVHDLLGVALFSQRRVDEAIAQFQESVRLNPSDADAQEHLRQALRMRASGGR
jgi:protein O-mannosyl-transferase